MLKGIDPRLNADVLYALRAMGHGDTLVIADTNFPSDAIARDDGLWRLLRMDNLTAGARRRGRCCRSCRSTPSSTISPARMEVVGAPDEVPASSREVQAAIDTAEGQPRPMVGDRALRLLRRAPAGLCRDPDRRAALLRLLHLPQGRDPAGRRA